jgi:hypothetical protein
MNIIIIGLEEEGKTENMRRLIPIVLCAILLSLYCSLGHAEDKANGYLWESMNDTTKTFFMSGFLAGYNTGYATGTGHGAAKVYNGIFDEFIPKIIAEQSRKCSDLIIANKKSAEGLVAMTFIGSVTKENFKESVDYYVWELNSFYKTYPLCRGRDLRMTLLAMTQIWMEGGALSYKKAGEGCLEKDK